MPERIEWLGLSAVYSEEELALMAELKATGDRRELEVLHELKALCRARVVDWMEPQELDAPPPHAPVSPRSDREPQNDERAPQRRRRRHYEAREYQGQDSFL